jgi:hypothetical protein
MAQNGLTPNVSAYPGSFVQSDVYGDNCSNVNAHTDSCTCPGSAWPATQFRALNDFYGAGTSSGANIKMCTVGTSASSEYSGGYQIDDAGTGSAGCRVTNANTGGCSCPAGTNAVQMRSIADGVGGVFVNTSIYMCMKPTATPATFGGAYQRDDNNFCRAANPYTSACSCPANFSPQAHRINVRNGSTIGGSNIYTCLPPAQSVQICPGQNADPTGRISATTQIQACIDSTPPGGTLALPAGTYLLDNRVLLFGGVKLTTQGMTSQNQPCGNGLPCATFKASPALGTQHNGMIFSVDQTNVTIDHIVLDGNRYKRLGSFAYQQCLAGTAEGKAYGFNANLLNCQSCTVTNSISTGALCGSALSITGINATVAYNTILNNGDNAVPGAWADGMTIGSDNASIHHNIFRDNSDIGFIFVRGANATVQNNTVIQEKMRAFAGFMMDNFSIVGNGNFSGALISNNTVTCSPGKCHYAVNLGPRPWNAGAPNIEGGTFSGNTISGGAITLNIDGAGTSGNLMTISGNNIGAARTGVATLCKQGQQRTVLGVRYSQGKLSTPTPPTSNWLTGTQTVADLVQDTSNCEGD